MRRVWLFASALLAIGGCAAQRVSWTPPTGGEDAAFETAAVNCENTAAARFPPVTFGSPGYFPTPNTWCIPTAGGPSCMMINEGYLPQARAAIDTNATPRETAFRACMVAGGWRPVHEALGELFTLSPGAPDAAVARALTDCETTFKGRPATGTAAAAKFNQCVTTRARELSGPRPPA